MTAPPVSPEATTANIATTDPRVREQLQLADLARAMVVTRDNKLDAEQRVLDLNHAERCVRDVLDPICDANYRAWKTSTDKRAEVLKPIEDARTYLRRECAGVQRQLDDEATVEAARKAVETAAAERRRLEAEAERTGAVDVEEGVALLEDAKAVQKPALAAVRVAPAKVAGITYRDNWKWEFVDAKGRAVTEPDHSIIPDQYKLVDRVAISGVVRSLKDRTNIPGIRVYNDRQPVETGGRR